MPRIRDWSLSNAPLHEHDCSNCEMIGTVTYEGSLGHPREFCDVYVCPQGGSYPTVVIRSGDDGPDYWSGPHLAEERDDHDPDPRMLPWLPPALRHIARERMIRMREDAA